MKRLFTAACLTLTAHAAVAEPVGALTSAAGDPARGEQVFLDAERGHCHLCHALPSTGAPFPGNIGPSLANIGDRLSAEELRGRIVDPTLANPDTVMPAYYRVTNLRQVATEFRGKPILSEQEVEDLVAFLRAQRHSTESKVP